MEIVLAPSPDSRMSEADLVIMRKRLEVIETMSEATAEGLSDLLPALEETTAFAAIRVIETMLRAMRETGRDEYQRQILTYRGFDDHTLVDRLETAANTHKEFLGVGSELIVETYRLLCPDQHAAEDRHRAGLLFIRRIAEICAFGLDLNRRKRGHLRLV